jgi:energy-coupling factor transporter ATP-binding protein EcfA2
MASNAELQARDISYRLPNGRALFSKLSLSLSQGEFVLLYGENGCGKSTLLQILAGIKQPVMGEIQFTGISESKLPSAVGLVLQNPDHQLLAATVEEELALALEFRAVAADEIFRRVEEYLKRFDLDELRRRSPETLSGGQKQRVAVAAVMIAEPSFLLLDEPDSYLDAPARRELQQAIADVRRKVGIVWTCADADFLPEADRCLLLNEGGLRQVDRATLYSDVADRAS